MPRSTAETRAARSSTRRARSSASTRPSRPAPPVLAGVTYRIGGDILTKVDGAPLRSVTDLRDTLSAKRPGDTISLELYRGSRKRTVHVKLGREPGQAPG